MEILLLACVSIAEDLWMRSSLRTALAYEGSAREYARIVVKR